MFAAPKKNRPFQFSLLHLILFVSALGILCGIVGILIGRAREAANRASCSSNLALIVLALQRYHDVHGTLPAPYITGKKGQPTHSWRVALLPFMERQDLYNQYDFSEPWDGPNNRKLHDKMPEEFRCPSANGSGKNVTNYMVVVGKNTMFEANKWTKMSDATDGTTNTIMVVEVTGSTTNWMEPKDLDLGSLPMKINVSKNGKCISSHHHSGAMVGLADGSTHYLLNTISPDTLRRLIIRNDGEITGSF